MLHFYAEQYMNRCRMFLLRLYRLTWTLILKAYPSGDVIDWSSVPFGHILFIDTGNSWLLSLEPSFFAWPMGAWFPIVPGSLTDGLSVLVGTLYLTTRSSSVALWKASHKKSSLPYSALHLRWSIRILDQRSWEHKILSYEVLVTYPYDLLLNLIH